MSFNPYQNYGAGIAALGPVQAMSDRNEAQTYMANNGQMYASGGIASLAGGGDADSGAPRVYKYDPVTQTYTLQGEDKAKTAMEEELLRQQRAAQASGGSGSASVPSAWDLMSDKDKAAYYAANPTMAKVTQTLQSLFGRTALGMAQRAFAPEVVAREAAIARGIDTSLGQYGTTGKGSAYGIGVGSKLGINAMDAMSDAASAGGYGTTGPGSATGIGVGSTSGINAMDAMSDAAAGLGGPSGGEGGGGTGDTGGDGTGSGADAGGSGDCVDPAVLIMLGNKTYVPAGTIKVGDVLFAMHEKTQEFGLYPVEHSEEVQQPKAIVTFDDGSTMTTSHSHKFFMTDGSWKQVYQLEPAHVVKAIDGKRDKAVASVEDIGEGPVMKITVSDAHTYVSEDLISHNMKAAGGRVRQRYAMGGSLGGLAALAAGGQAGYNLGGYSDGGRLLRGPGDGVSDSIPAIIGSRQPARLADGEFVVPARIVSELGNGSTEAGARKLYAMMDRIQKARKKSIGKDRVAVNSRADKNLPA